LSPRGRSTGDRSIGPARSISVATSGLRSDPARQTAPNPDRQAESRERRGLIKRPVRSQCWQLCLPHPF
jgi:hypothetical protein